MARQSITFLLDFKKGPDCSILESGLLVDKHVMLTLTHHVTRNI